jgi:site-specific DNA-methyltransferase (adenine-specific)
MQINKVYNENCLDTMSRMPDEFIDLTVTSPPYDNLRTYNGYSFDFESIAKELYRVTKEGGVVVWIVGDATINGSESGTSFRQALYFKEIGFNLHDTMIYNRNARFPENVRYYQEFEYMFVFSKGKPKAFNALTQRKTEETIRDLKRRSNQKTKVRNDNKKVIQNRFTEKSKDNELRVKSNIWTYSVGGGKTSKDKIAFKHPAIFPEQLANDHIISWSNESDLVYDPFMGSGTTAKMAIANNRNWIGSEISSEYCDIIHERIKQTKLL